MINPVVVFDTKEEADTLQERDFLLYLDTIEDPDIKLQTTSWDTPIRRLDGKFTYFIYPPADYTGYTIVEYNETDYYMGE